MRENPWRRGAGGLGLALGAVMFVVASFYVVIIGSDVLFGTSALVGSTVTVARDALELPLVLLVVASTAAVAAFRAAWNYGWRGGRGWPLIGASGLWLLSLVLAAFLWLLVTSS